MDGIIFDVDGTLWDSTDVVAKAWNQAIAEHSELPANLTGSGLLPLFGKTMDEITAAIFPSLPLSEREKLFLICYDYENRLLATEPGTLYPHVRETFQSLASDYDLYIVSNCQCGYIDVFLESTGLTSYVKDFLCFGDTSAPKEETLRQLMRRHQLQNVVYIGDTQGDSDACRKANIPFIFAEYGFGSVPDAEIRMKDMEELPAIIQKWKHR